MSTFDPVATAKFNLPVSRAATTQLIGTDGNDWLVGGGENDRLVGKGGDDKMIGGTGDDTYVVPASGQITIEEHPNEGIDTVIDYARLFTLPDNVENLRLRGNYAHTAMGNGLSNIITASGAGDTIDGGGGKDILIGGAGADTFIIREGYGDTLIKNFGANDTLQLRGFAFADSNAVVHALTQIAAGVALDLGDGHGVVFKGANLSSFQASNFTVLDSVAPTPAPTPAPAPLPTLSIGDASVSEGGAEIFAVNLSAPSAAPVDVAFATHDGTARAGTDYTAASGTLHFDPGQTSQTVTIQTLPDALDSSETFSVSLTQPSNATLGVATGSGTILDTPASPTPDPTPTPAPNPDPTPVLSVSGGSVSEGAQETVTVTLSQASTQPVSVDFATHDGTAIAGTDYIATSGTLTFAPGQTSQTVIVQTLADQVANEGNESFTLSLTNAVQATLGTATATGTILDATPSPNPAPTPSPSGGPWTPTPVPGPSPDGLLHLPTLLQPQNPGDVVAFRLENDTNGTLAGHEITFGQVFKPGDVPAGTHLTVHIGGQEIPVQMDVKATNPDGSVRMAIITVQAPSLPAHTYEDVMLSKAAPTLATKPDLDISSILSKGYNLELDLTFHNADGSTTAAKLNAATLLQQAVANGGLDYWMKGPLATEVRIDAAINDHMHARFDITANADGIVHTDVSVLNDPAYKPGKPTYTYDAVINEGSSVDFSASNIHQYHNTSWHHEVWTGGAPQIDVKYDVPYLDATGAIPNFDAAVGVDPSTIAQRAGALTAANTGPMGTANLTVDMTTAGARDDIGPTTKWSAMYLQTMDPAAKQVMLANADAAGSVPWHLTDEATGQPVSVDNHPGLWTDYRGTPDNYGPDSLPTTYTDQNTPFTLGEDHVPALTYIPYLLTGSRYYADELKAQAAFDLTSIDPNVRSGAQGLVDNPYNQVRLQAWALRDLVDTAYILPDNDPMKAYFEAKANANLDDMFQKYVVDDFMKSTGQVKGWVLGDYGNEHMIAPWQEDYLVTTFADAAARGFVKGAQMLEWMDHFVSGRFLAGAQGFDPHDGVAYNLYLYSAAYGQQFDPATAQFVSTWAAVEKGMDPVTNGGPAWTADGVPTSASSYIAIAKASTADIISATGSPAAVEAYGFLVGNSPQMVADYPNDPTWNIVPKLADGKYLAVADQHVITSASSSPISFGNHDQLIFDASSGGNTLQGGSGINLLFAGNGMNDTLIGGQGGNFLFGGAGADRLVGGAGTNYLKGNGGADVFVFKTTDVATDRVADFTPGLDHIEVHNAGGTAITTASLTAGATADAQGNAVLHLSDQHAVTLEHVGLAQLHTHADWFIVS